MIETKAAASAITGWWREMYPDGDRPNNARSAAILRRAGSIPALCSLSETLGLCRRLEARFDDLERVALIAGVLAWVRGSTQSRLASILGSPKAGSGDQPIMSNSRFQKLIEAPDPDSQLIAFRRAVIMAGQTANVHDLSVSLLEWNNPNRREQRVRRWLYDYFSVAVPMQTPPAEASIQNTETIA